LKFFIDDISKKVDAQLVFPAPEKLIKKYAKKKKKGFIT